MPIPNVTPYTGTLPDINDPATFDARMTAFTTWFNGVVTEIEATVSGMNTALNDDGTTLDTAGQALRVSLNANTTATTAGSASAYTLAPADTITAYADGESFRLTPHVTNLQNSTINIDGLGALPIQKLVGGSLVGVDAGDLLAGEIHLLEIVAGGTVAKLISTPINDVLEAVALDEDDFASNSATRPPSQQSTLSYLSGGSSGPTATTSGSNFDVTGIPANVRRIEIMLNGVGLNGAGNLLVQLGASGGIEAAGYLGSAGNFSDLSTTVSTNNSGFPVYLGDPARGASGLLTLVRGAGNDWYSQHGAHLSGSTQAASVGGGYKLLPGTLTQIRLTRDSASLFDAGEFSVRWFYN